ncbi:anti-sigma factor [Flagellimonas sp. HMM57]|uniref:anti-sigma factor n=1 Tax=unclassified Flagellimonas TaxID=2644544 RepID=UPI0013D50427|nr:MULTISPECIES: anti-sigma factor [unclassified Flagellimonas]UII75446.1 anti-sigma factor [Flagellimonas sp. HMM57]
MDIEKYIASGILELYVAGALSAEENLEVQHYALQYPEIQKEIEGIEEAMLQLTKSASPGVTDTDFKKVLARLDDTIPFLPAASKKRIAWTSYMGWAASLVLITGLAWMYLQNKNLKSEIELTNQENKNLQHTITKTQNAITEKEALLQELRSNNVTVVALGGQDVSPNSYAKAYWNKTEEKVIIDAQGLPTPPTGYAYQVWSLTLDPLTPTSLGLLGNFDTDTSRLFTLPNTNESQAFGITLEPEGGSSTPTMEQLYTLGTVGP